MNITIKYFGAIAEQAGISIESMRLEKEQVDLAELKAVCFKKHNISDTDSIQTAINRELQETGYLQTGDELAFLPPFAGG